MAAATLLVMLHASLARSAEPPAPALPATATAASTQHDVPATGAEAFRYRLRIDAPSALRPLIEANVGLARWQDFADMTPPLFDRLARDALGETRDVAAASGWFGAHAEISVDARDKPATVVLTLTPGDPVRIRDVNVQVNGAAASDSPIGTGAIARLQGDWRLPQGDVFTQSRWTLAKNTAVAQLAASGFAATAIAASQASIDPDALAADLAVTLASGPLFHFGDLHITGLKRYPAELVLNFSTIAKGSRYDQPALDQFVRRLNASGYFASVQATIDADPAHAEASPVNVAVIEAPTKRIDTGIGYSTDTRFRANVSYRDVDVDSHATQLAIDARLEQKLSSLSARLTKPPSAAGWTDSVSAQVERTDIENLVTATAVAGVRRQGIDERDNWNFGAAYYFDRQSPQGSDDITSHALYVDAIRTWRRTDDLIAPTRGFNFALQTGAGIPGVSTRGFGRVIAQFAAWHPLARNFEVSMRAEAGAVIADTRNGIPSALLFRTGGDTTVRGYAFQSLGVKSGDAIVPGRYYAVASGEVTRWINDTIGIATFVDAGNAVDAPRELKHLALGYGVGARLRTPIGPFRLDLAYGQDVHQVRVHFSVGLAF
ncbi:MAG: BamA/TamA family outer membrane protein [Casimicrobiaceae bacterium]